MSEESYIGVVKSIFKNTGPGGSLKVCHIELKEKRRTLVRVVSGAVREGDKIVLMDCDREYKGN